MKRVLLFPALVGTAWTQQAEPAGPAEQALRSQAERYCQLMVAKKYREAEKLVAVASREDYYNSSKPDIRGFEILKIDVAPDGMRARVLVKSRMAVVAMGKAQIFEIPSQTDWILEEGEWRWFIDKKAAIPTPFGMLNANQNEKADPRTEQIGKAPDIGELMRSVTLEKSEVSIDSEADVLILVRNKLPGVARVELASSTVKGVSASLSGTEVPGNGSVTLRLHWEKDAGQHAGGTVQVAVSPLGQLLTLQVRVAQAK